jgi:hypothetical protein
MLVIKFQRFHIRRDSTIVIRSFREESDFDFCTNAFFTPDLNFAPNAFRRDDTVDNSQSKASPGL